MILISVVFRVYDSDGNEYLDSQVRNFNLLTLFAPGMFNKKDMVHVGETFVVINNDPVKEMQKCLLVLSISKKIFSKLKNQVCILLSSVRN